MQHLSDLRQYVTDIASIPRVSHEEACQLKSHLAAARQGSFSPNLATQAEHWLIEGHLWLVVSLVRRSPARLCILSPLDLVQEGTLGLLRAVERFDFAAPGNFTAYASTTIRYAILDALPLEDTVKVSYDLSWRNRTDERVEALRGLQPLSLDAAYAEDGGNLADITPAPPLVLPDSEEEEERHQAKRAQVEALLAQLTPREQQVLHLRYRLDEADGRAHTLAAIALHLDLDCSTVCNIERRALQKLRSSQHPETEEDYSPQTHRRQGAPRPAQDQMQRQQEQSQRLAAACVALEVQETPISVRSLACLTHLDKEVIQPFLRKYWQRLGTEQERLAAACAELEAEDVPVTMSRLCSRAHVGCKVAAAFLKDCRPAIKPKQHPVVKVKPARPAKATSQERMQKAFGHLLAQGEQITRTRLRQEAGVSTDAAGTFLRSQRAADTAAVPQG
jgi:RNA polymerase sigma factor (sigma-70 family)